jgi:hypothetical protein
LLPTQSYILDLLADSGHGSAGALFPPENMITTALIWIKLMVVQSTIAFFKCIPMGQSVFVDPKFQEQSVCKTSSPNWPS